MAPLAGGLTITCAPATTPTLPPAGPGAMPAPSPGGSDNIPVIAGGVGGGVALLAIAGVVAYKLKKKTPSSPPPSYEDLVGA